MTFHMENLDLSLQMKKGKLYKLPCISKLFLKGNLILPA